MTATYTIPATDNGDGTWTANLVDNGDGTWTYTPTPARDIDITASPVTTGWQVMGTTGYPLAPGPVNANNGYAAGAVTVDALTAAPTLTTWSAGPTWIED